MNRLRAMVLVAFLLGCGGEPLMETAADAPVACTTYADCIGIGCCIPGPGGSVCVAPGASNGGTTCVLQGARCTSDAMCPSGSCEQQNADPSYLTCGSIH